MSAAAAAQWWKSAVVYQIYRGRPESGSAESGLTLHPWEARVYRRDSWNR